jgi:hypothetical protein
MSITAKRVKVTVMSSSIFRFMGGKYTVKGKVGDGARELFHRPAHHLIAMTGIHSMPP